MRTFVIAFVLLGAGVAQAQQAPVFYAYGADSGRTVYVNRFSMVPPHKRGDAWAIDLSQVDLHEELAEKLADAVEAELRFLKESDPCNAARDEEIAGAWRHLWRRHGPWFLASAAAVILVLMTPWMVARTPPGVWSRFLMVALPALGMTALLAVSATRATQSLHAVEELVKLCDTREVKGTPRTQLVRLSEMHEYIEQLYQDQYDTIERISEIQ